MASHASHAPLAHAPLSMRCEYEPGPRQVGEAPVAFLSLNRGREWCCPGSRPEAVVAACAIPFRRRLEEPGIPGDQVFPNDVEVEVEAEARCLRDGDEAILDERLR